MQVAQCAESAPDLATKALNGSAVTLLDNVTGNIRVVVMEYGVFASL